MKCAKYLLAASAAAAAVGLLWKTKEVSQGVRAGLGSCAAVIIPSLFPFMILAGLIAATQAGAVLSRAVSGFTRRVIGMPENLGAVLLMSFVGGFPVGARMLSDMLARREIDRETAERALCCCVNAGPSFLISAVGAGMLGSRAAGLALLGAQVLSSLAVGALAFRGARAGSPPARAPERSRDAFVNAVRSAASGILSICAFVVAFSAVTALLRAVGLTGALAGALGKLFPALGEPFFTAALAGLLEATGGCIAAASLGGRAGFLLCAFLVSFSSLSIIFQVRSCFFDGCGVRFGRFYRSRLLHGGLTTLFAALFARWLPPAVLAASASLSAPVPRADPHAVLPALCLLCMCSILAFPEWRRNVHFYK